MKWHSIDFFLFALIILLLLKIHKKNRSYYTSPDPLIETIRLDLLKVDARAGSLKFFASDKSYTEDKKDVFLCLKDEHGNYYPYNFLLYVSLHELAHAISITIDDKHTGKEFNKNFDYLLQKAAEIKIYNPREPLITDYCGLKN